MKLVNKMFAVFLGVATLAVSVNAQAATCASHLRFVHGHAFKDEAISVVVNGVQTDALQFREIGKYLSVESGKKHVQFFSTITGELIGEKTFVAGSGMAYTILVAGPAKGPEGTLYGNSSPFILVDDITPPNTGRWKGHWYRMSETNVVIDFRISSASDYNNEIYRLYAKPNRASYQLPDHVAGTYNFNPVLPGSSEPFFNEALNPPRKVELGNISIGGGQVIDVFALGNFLGKGPNSLDLTYQIYTPVISTESGCIGIQY